MSHFLIVLSPLCKLQNLRTFSSLIIQIFDVYFKQLVPRKYEAPVYVRMLIQYIYFKFKENDTEIFQNSHIILVIKIILL